MTALERREKILNILIERKTEKIDNLAFEFSVTTRTIKNDVLILSLSYPVYTQTGSAGGVFIDKDYYLHKQYLKREEQESLEQILQFANPEQQKILNGILKKYSRPKLSNQ